MNDDDGWWGTRRALLAPAPVWVELLQVLPPQRVRLDGVALRVKQFGINNAEVVPGELISWHQTAAGDWYAFARFEVTNRSGRARLTLTQLVPARAVRPR